MGSIFEIMFGLKRSGVLVSFLRTLSIFLSTFFLTFVMLKYGLALSYGVNTSLWANIAKKYSDLLLLTMYERKNPIYGAVV